MKTLEDIQKRFAQATEKEHWEKIQVLLFSEDKENVVMGKNLLETLDEEVYYDGVCSFLEDDGSGNWKLKEGLGCENELALKVEILRMAEENIGHEIKESFDNGCLEEFFVVVCGEIEFGELSENQKERLLSKVSEMVEVKGEKGSFLVMKYQVTHALWESVTGQNPSEFRGASCPVEMVSWLDSVIFANQLSEKEDYEKVYEIPEGMEERCKNQIDLHDYVLDEYAQSIKVNEGANGYRLPTSAEWAYAARGGEDYKYAGSNNLDEVDWYEDNIGGETHGVGQNKSNGYGLYDMSGNVLEWCFDLYTHNSSIRISRGGSWWYPAYRCEVSHHFRFFPSNHYRDLGIRFLDLYHKGPDPLLSSIYSEFHRQSPFLKCRNSLLFLPLQKRHFP